MIRATRFGGVAKHMDQIGIRSGPDLVQIRAEVNDIDQTPVSNPN
ncbi:hypothetical protein [Halochromatium roseum]|nr:hypothetical protein [Halochromatium roseum]